MTKPSRPRSKGREARCGSSFRVLMARIAQKPPMPRGTIVASVPPANITWASPILIVRQASPIACVEVAHAEQVATLGPRSLLYIENRPEAMFRINAGIMKGDSRPGPLLSRTMCCSSVVCRPPMPEPIITPISSRLDFSRSRPESSNAWCPANTPKRAKRSMRRASLELGNAGAGSKFFTSPAILQS